MTDNVVTLYSKPNPVEIEIEMTDEEIMDILDELQRSPKGEFMEFHFILLSDRKCITIRAEVPTE